MTTFANSEQMDASEARGRALLAICRAAPAELPFQGELDEGDRVFNAFFLLASDAFTALSADNIGQQPAAVRGFAYGFGLFMVQAEPEVQAMIRLHFEAGIDEARRDIAEALTPKGNA